MISDLTVVCEQVAISATIFTCDNPVSPTVIALRQFRQIIATRREKAEIDFVTRE
jgi:hypothetical protein